MGKHGHMEMGYARGKKTLFSADNGERLNYTANVYHVDAGINTAGSSRWQLGLGLRAFHVRHKLKYVPPTIDFGNPVVNVIQTI